MRQAHIIANYPRKWRQLVRVSVGQRVVFNWRVRSLRHACRVLHCFAAKIMSSDVSAKGLWQRQLLFNYRSKYGHLQVDVEQGKKENRSNYLWTMKLEEFLSKYNDSDIYLVNSLPREMMGLSTFIGLSHERQKYNRKQRKYWFKNNYFVVA